jgi:hypothetical protein
MMKQLRTLVIIGLAVVAATGLVTIARSQNPGSAAVASFNADGSLNLPTGYRHWVHIGTRLKPIGINILDGLLTKTPEIFNAYLEPHALTLFRKTGRWPDGTQIVKEFSAVRVGPDCDPATFLCSSPIGAGIFESGFAGLGMMVKDDKRFSDAPCHWGYFSFGHKPAPYNPTASLRPKNTCEACHVALASRTDYVISQAHIGLAAADDESH